MQAVRPAATPHLPSWWWRLSAQFKDAAERSLRYAEPNLSAIALTGVLGFFGYYFAYSYFQPSGFESPLLRTIAAAICLPVVFHNRLPIAAQRFMPLLWCFAVTYCLPFFFAYMLLQNSQHGDTNSLIWPLSYVFALISLVMLIHDGKLIALMFALGTMSAIAIFVAANETIMVRGIIENCVEPMPVYLFILVGGTLYNRHRETVQQEMLRAVSSVGSNIAHELRTPLLGIKANAQGVRRYLPDLVRAYEMARDQNLPVPPIRARHLDSMREALDRIESETDFSNTIIDMLLINSERSRIEPGEFTRISALDCARKAIARFPFGSEAERRLLHLSEKNDFNFIGSELLFVHVLFNLLKNALFYLARAGKGELYIWIENDIGTNRIYVMDTGTGIHPSVLPRIFDRFYTSQSTGGGSGIGLSFCRSVMDSFNGRIDCESQLGEFTRFILSFPAIPDHG